LQRVNGHDMRDGSIKNKMENWQNYYTRVLSTDQADEFASTLSHELRTPLTSIRGALGLLRGGLLDPKSKQGERLLEIAVNNTDRLVHLTTVLEQERDRFFILSPDMLAISGFDGYFKRLNPSWEKTLGFTKAELLAKPYIEFVHPEDRTAMLAAEQKLLSGAESIALENRYLCKDGSYKWFLWNAVPYLEEQLIYAIGRDITERKRAEARLQRTQAFLNSVVENLPVGVFIKDAKGVPTGTPLKYVLWNKAGEEIIGFTNEQMIGKTDYDFFPEEQADLFVATDQEVLASGKLLDIPEKPMQTAHQGQRILHTRKVPIKDAEGNPQYLLGICQDITERKQTEQALRQSEERFRSLVSNVPGAIFRCACDADWTMEFISDAIAEITGYPASDFIQNKVRRFASIIHPDDAPSDESLVLKAVRLRVPYIVEYRIIRADGSIRWVYEKGQGAFDENGKLICLDGAIFDITERKRTEGRLGAQHAITRVLTEATTTNEAIPKILQALCETLGWKLGEFWSLDQKINVLRCREIWSAASNPIPEFEAITRQITVAPGIGLAGRIWESGTPHWISDVVQDDNFLRTALAYKENLHAALGFPIISRSTILGVLTFFSQDIQPQDEELLKMVAAIGSQIGQFIERKRAKEALKQSEAQLRQQTTQLQQAFQTLKHTQAQLVQSEKMSALGQLVAGVAHEINNPISFVHGNLDYTNQYAQDLLQMLRLYQKYYPNPAPEIKAEAEQIDLDFIVEDLPKLVYSMKMGTDRIREIVLSLRNFSRLDESQKKLADIQEGIDSTLLILQSQLIDKPQRLGIKIIKEYGNIPNVECYPGQLNQVFINILNNAIDALEEKRRRGVEEQRSTEEPEQTSTLSLNHAMTPLPCIRIRTEVLEAGDIVIRIADNGSGMIEDIKNRVFDPFFTTKPVGNGTGLGLSISYQIVVEKHGGLLKCTSQIGQGTEFWIQIPRQKQHDSKLPHSER